MTVGFDPAVAMFVCAVPAVVLNGLSIGLRMYERSLQRKSEFKLARFQRRLREGGIRSLPR